MRISDWSSDVCSSDLDVELFGFTGVQCFQYLVALQIDQVGVGQPGFLQRLPTDMLRVVAMLRHPQLFHRPRIRVLVEDGDDLEVDEPVGRRVLARFHFAATEVDRQRIGIGQQARSEEHTSELQSLMRISYAVFCLKKKMRNKTPTREYKH